MTNDVSAAGVRRSRFTRGLRKLLAHTLAGRGRWSGAPRFRLAIVKLDRLGDFVLALGAIRLLLAEFGETRCVLIVSPVAEPLAAREFPRTPRLVLPASQGHGKAAMVALRLRGALARCSAEAVVVLRHQRWDYDELVLSWLPANVHHRVDDGSTRRFGARWRTFDFRGPGLITWDRVSPEGRAQDACRELALHRAVLEQVLGRPVAPEALVPRLDGGAAEPGAIVVTPFGSERIKDFPVSLLAAGIEESRERLGPKPIRLLGSPSRADDLAVLSEQLGQAGVAVDRPSTDLSFTEYVNAVIAAPLVITTDTATAHLATAADRPAVIVLGGGHYGQFGPWARSGRQRWLTHPIECFGCNWVCQHPEPFCLTRISTAQVREAVRAALA